MDVYWPPVHCSPCSGKWFGKTVITSYSIHYTKLYDLSIIVSLPIGIAGSFIFARILGVDNNIYLQISLVMLIGLLAKNAILIVEFARQRRESGMSIIEAAVEGATARLRPILMTSFAFIVGLIPLVIGTGVGAT